MPRARYVYATESLRHSVDNSRGVSSGIAVILLVGVVVIVSGTVAVSVFGQFETEPRPAPEVSITVDTARIGNGVATDDAVILTHTAGQTLDRGEVIVQVGSDTVFNRTVNTDRGPSPDRTRGLVVEVDRGRFNDLNKPGSGPPGQADGDSSNVVNEWARGISAGDRLVIQERNDPRSYDVTSPTTKVVGFPH